MSKRDRDQIGDWARRKAKKSSPQDRMLTDFLRAKTPQEKREVIKNFAPYYFVFGNKLEPNNVRYEGEEDGDTL